MEALREAEAELTVYVHPSNAADVRGAVARQLSALLFSYEERFDGVLLAHETKLINEDNKDDKSEVEGKKKVKDKKVKVLRAKILNGLVPYFGVRVHANLLIFSPQPDMILEGKVEILRKESIHAIILGIFSVAIMSDDIRERFKFKRKSDGGRFVSRLDRQHVIKRGTMIRFLVKGVDTEMNCHITGSLIPPHTGSMCWLSVHDAEYAAEIKSGDASIKIEQNEQEHRILKNEDSMVKSERTHKSRKRSIENR
ncbi:DNA-directed RNA polymerase I subunit rpa43 [Panicum miliaceum]|uniref:DNA-directed RNA polymerase subunit n=1 Tax=Panicum miliaceum TaxID=4540 RepID=A0A3L6T2V9_PANMI|nr:DNA-directed RNA polymerase I subunit rpa43 [Panicum miliaceum]